MEPNEKDLCQHEPKDVHCKVHDKYYCQKCILDHLKTMHKLDFSDVGFVIQAVKEAIQKKSDQCKIAKELIAEQKNILERKVAALKNNEALDALYKEGVSKLRKEIEKAKQLKTPTIKALEEMTKKLSRHEMEYEKLFTSHQGVLKDIKEGRTEGLNKLRNAGKGVEKEPIDYQPLLKEAKKVGQEALKFQEKGVNTDKEVEAMTAKAISIAKAALKDAVAAYSAEYSTKAVQKKGNKLNECKEEIARLREKINALKNIAAGIEENQKKTKEELLPVASVIEKNKKEIDKMDEMLKKFFKCLTCGTMLCKDCNYECKFCHKKQCKGCLLKCKNCEKDFCKDCIKPCPRCGEKCCPDCIKEESCCDESYLKLDPACTKIYGISYVLGSSATLNYFDLITKKAN